MKFPSPEDTIIVMTVSNGGRRVTRGEHYSSFQPHMLEKNISIPCNVMDESNCIGNLFSYSREVGKNEGNYTVGSNGNGCVNSFWRVRNLMRCWCWWHRRYNYIKKFNGILFRFWDVGTISTRTLLGGTILRHPGDAYLMKVQGVDNFSGWRMLRFIKWCRWMLMFPKMIANGLNKSVESIGACLLLWRNENSM